MKEYYEHSILKFEGEYLNGKRNGKGKEFDYRKGVLMFEGEYLNGKRNGTGKEYIVIDIDRGGEIWNRRGRIINSSYKKEREYDLKLIFEGDYLNGQRWNGKGEEYSNDENSNIICSYEVEYLNGKNVNDKTHFLKNGHNKEYSDDNLIFEGEFINYRRCGKGIEYDDKGRILFEGEYLNNFRFKGKKYIAGRLEYEGEYLWNKKWNGKGYDEKGNILYEIKNGTGKAKEYDDEGKLIFDGEYLNGKRNGRAKEYGEIEFDGEYFDGKKWNGNIKKYDRKTLIFEGTYLNGKINGKAKEYNPYTGKLEFEGEYLNGQKWNGIEIIIETDDFDFIESISKGKYVEGKYEPIHD